MTKEEMQKRIDELEAQQQADNFDPATADGKTIIAEFKKLVGQMAVLESKEDAAAKHKEAYDKEALRLEDRMRSANKWGTKEIKRIVDKLTEVAQKEYTHGIPLQNLEKHVDELEKELLAEIKEEKAADKKAGKKDGDKDKKDDKGDKDKKAGDDGDPIGENTPNPDDVGDPPNDEGGSMEDNKQATALANAASATSVLNNNSDERPPDPEVMKSQIASVVKLAADTSPEDLNPDATLPRGDL